MKNGPWEIDGDELRGLGPDDLVKLVQRLFDAEAQRCGMSKSNYSVGVNPNASDGGCDAYTPATNGESDFIPTEETCWQLKSGDASQVARLTANQETAKSRAVEVLSRGGAYRLIASGSSTGRHGELERETALIEIAKNKGLPTDKIRVIGSEELARWCSQFPAIIKRLSKIPTNLLTFDEWSADPYFSTKYYSNNEMKAALSAVCNRIASEDTNAFHTHIFGQPGVGKTRFAVEVCRVLDRASSIVYSPSADMASIQTFLDVLRASDGMSAILIVDECSRNDVDQLVKRVSALRSRIHLITVGPEKPIENSLTVSIDIPPLGREEMETFLQETYTSMPMEQRGIIHQYAEGYIKFVELIVIALQQNRSGNMTEIMSSDGIASFIDRIMEVIDQPARPYLLVLSLFESIGFFDERQIEGETVAKFFGWNFGEMRQGLDQVHRKHGIVPLAGDIRYISPKPLAICLAMRSLEIHKERMLDLAQTVQPVSQSLYDALLGRLSDIATHPEAKGVSEALLGDDFLTLSDFNDSTKVRVWRQLNVADPARAAVNVWKALEASTLDERMALNGDARRELIWGLESLIRIPEAYESAIRALAHLAVAENETWSNNATGDFIQHHQVFLSGTGQPYEKRLKILREIALVGTEYKRLAIQALSTVANNHYTGTWSGDDNGPFVPHEDWRPLTNKDQADCVRGALTLLGEFIEDGDMALGNELSESLGSIFSNLYRTYLYSEVLEVIKRFVAKYPDHRELLRKQVQNLMRGGVIRKETESEEFGRLREVHTLLSGDEMTERVRSYVGPWHLDIEESDKLEVKKLAQDFIENPALLDEHLDWLVSGNANNIWAFAQDLGQHDTESVLLEKIWGIRSRAIKADIRLVAGYLEGRMKEMGTEWLVALLDTLDVKKEEHAQCLLQIVWRSLQGSRGAEFVMKLLQESPLPDVAYNTLAYGGWALSIEIQDLAKIVEMLMQREEGKTVAMSILGQRLSQEASLLEDKGIHELALSLTLDPDLIVEKRSSHVYDWEHVAEMLMDGDMAQIVTAVFEAHDTKRGWFVRHSRAEQILHQAAEKNPALMWDILSKKLVDAKDQALFAIGFSSGLLEKLPAQKILEWCEEDPEERASLVAHLIGPDFGQDTSLFAQLADKYHSINGVSSSLSATLFSRSWSGSESAMWSALADRLEEAAARTKLPGLKAWIEGEIPSVKRQQERAKKREEEEKVRGFRG